MKEHFFYDQLRSLYNSCPAAVHNYYSLVMLCVSCFPKFQMAKEGFYCQYSILLYRVLSMCWGQGEGLGSEGNNSSINENVA